MRTSGAAQARRATRQSTLAVVALVALLAASVTTFLPLPASPEAVPAPVGLAQGAALRGAGAAASGAAPSAEEAWMPWRGCAVVLAAALLLVTAQPEPAQAGRLGSGLYAGNSEMQIQAKMAESKRQVLEDAEKKAEAKEKAKEAEAAQKQKALENFQKLEAEKAKERAARESQAKEAAPAPAGAPSAAPAAPAFNAEREKKIEEVRIQVLKSLEQRKVEASKQANEAEELAKRLEKLALDARATAEATKAALASIN